MRAPRKILVAFVLLVAAVAVAPPGAAAPGSDTGGFTTKWISDTEAVSDFWTSRRLAQAEPLPVRQMSQDELRDGETFEQGDPYVVEGDGPTGSAEATNLMASVSYPIPFTRNEVPDPSVEVMRTHGKIFGTSSTFGTFECSATVVNSDNKSVVWTAAHCVYANPEGFFTNLIFIPGYEDRNEPFGRWPAQQLLVSDDWKSNELPFDDYAALVVTPNQSGELLADVVGARGIAFNQQPNEAIEALGYPAMPSNLFNGEKLVGCQSTGSWRLIKPLIAIGCDMKEGSSGGGWIIHGEYVASVTSIGIRGLGPIQFGPHLDDRALALYNLARGGTTVFPQPTVNRQTYQKHKMRITLTLRNHLIAKGRVEAVSGFAGCAYLGPVQVVKVKFDRQGNPVIARFFKTVFTRPDGSYRVKLPDRAGYYGAILYAGGYDLDTDCAQKLSILRRHRH